jgi:predicted RNase H-like HicB family nuclease
MNKLFWLIAGVAIGVVAAKQIEENPQAKKTYEEAKASLQEFAEAVSEGYKERESELSKPARKPAAKTARKSPAKSSARSTAKKTAAKSKPAGK